MQTKIPCPFCHQPSQVYWASRSVWQCTHCLLVFRHETEILAGLDDYYQEGWQNKSDNPKIVGNTSFELAQNYTQLLLKQLQRQNFQDQTILEFGAGKGTMMHALAKSGATVYGTDPYSFPVLQTQGLSAFATLDQLPNALCFDGIVAIQVVEHLPKPWEILNALRVRLVNSGWIYISTINVNSLNARLSRSQWREVKNHGHLFFFNRHSIEAILANAGYANFRRIEAPITYPDHSLPRRFLGHVLQHFAGGGELAYLAWK